MVVRRVVTRVVTATTRRHGFHVSRPFRGSTPTLELASDSLSGEFDVTVASSPAEALEIAERTAFAIVCCDFAMPGMDGVKLLDRLAKTLPAMKAILLTGSDLAAAKSSQVALAVLTKPFRPSELLGIVRALAEDDLSRAIELADRWGVSITTAKPPRFAGT